MAASTLCAATHAFLGLAPGLDSNPSCSQARRARCWKKNWRRRITTRNDRHLAPNRSYRRSNANGRSARHSPKCWSAPRTRRHVTKWRCDASHRHSLADGKRHLAKVALLGNDARSENRAHHGAAGSMRPAGSKRCGNCPKPGFRPREWLPVIPALNDSGTRAHSRCGALPRQEASYVLLRLPSGGARPCSSMADGELPHRYRHVPSHDPRMAAGA